VLFTKLSGDFGGILRTIHFDDGLEEKRLMYPTIIPMESKRVPVTQSLEEMGQDRSGNRGRRALPCAEEEHFHVGIFLSRAILSGFSTSGTRTPHIVSISGVYQLLDPN
jgi:hypothetical protein